MDEVSDEDFELFDDWRDDFNPFHQGGGDEAAPPPDMESDNEDNRRDSGENEGYDEDVDEQREREKALISSSKSILSCQPTIPSSGLPDCRGRSHTQWMTTKPLLGFEKALAAKREKTEVGAGVSLKDGRLRRQESALSCNTAEGVEASCDVTALAIYGAKGTRKLANPYKLSELTNRSRAPKFGDGPKPIVRWRRSSSSSAYEYDEHGRRIAGQKFMEGGKIKMELAITKLRKAFPRA